MQSLLRVAAIVAVAMSVEAGHAASKATPGRPVGNPAEWVLPGDYPAEALRARTEGATAFKLAFDRTGTVTSCTVTESSGSDLLDRTTCDILRDRARFIPGMDAKGRISDGTYESRVRWIIPQKTPAKIPLSLFPAQIGVAIDIDKEGRLEGCGMQDVKIAAGQGLADMISQNLCASLMKQRGEVSGLRLTDKAGEPNAAHVVVTVTITATAMTSMRKRHGSID